MLFKLVCVVQTCWESGIEFLSSIKVEEVLIISFKGLGGCPQGRTLGHISSLSLI